MIGVVIPAYRPDEDLLLEYLDELRATLDNVVLRIELDQPKGESALTKLTSRPDVTVGVSDRRRGKGAAITAGFEALLADDDVEILAFADADGSTPAAELKTIIDRLADSSADLCIGSRRHPEATVTTHQTRLRRRLGDTFVFLANAALPLSLTDYQCGAKAVTVPAWQTIRPHLYRSGFDWDLELLAVAAATNREIIEQPITWSDHPDSTVRPLRDGPQLLVGLFIARHRYQLLTDGSIHSRLNRLLSRGSPLIDRV